MKTLTNQQIFDKVLAHLRKQGHASNNSLGACLYRSGTGAMCAVGCLIPDSAYNPEIESIDVHLLPDEVLVASGIDPNDDVQMELCDNLQVAHDDDLAEFGADEWEVSMRIIAHKYDLVYTPRTETQNA